MLTHAAPVDATTATPFETFWNQEKRWGTIETEERIRDGRVGGCATCSARPVICRSCDAPARDCCHGHNVEFVPSLPVGLTDVRTAARRPPPAAWCQCRGAGRRS